MISPTRRRRSATAGTPPRASSRASTKTGSFSRTARVSRSRRSGTRSASEHVSELGYRFECVRGRRAASRWTTTAVACPCGIVAEALRLGVASVASLAEVDNSSAAAFPVAWTSSLGLGPHRLRSRHRADRAVLGAFDSWRPWRPAIVVDGVPVCHVRRYGSRTPPARDPPTPPSRGSSFSTRSTSPRRGSRGSRTGRSAPSRRRFGSGRSPRTAGLPPTPPVVGGSASPSWPAQLVKRLTKRV